MVIILHEDGYSIYYSNCHLCLGAYTQPCYCVLVEKIGNYGIMILEIIFPIPELLEVEAHVIHPSLPMSHT